VELELYVWREEAADDDYATDMGGVDQACCFYDHEQGQAARASVEVGGRQHERGLTCASYVGLDWLAFLLRTRILRTQTIY